MIRKTYRRRQTKRKTSRSRTHKLKKKIVRHRKGGRLNNNARFDDRRGELINALQDIMDRAEQGREQPNVNEMTFVDEIRAFEDEADAIDAHFGNHDMEHMLNQRIEDIMHIFGLVNPNGNNNNANTITLPNINRNNNNNNNNNNRLN